MLNSVHNKSMKVQERRLKPIWNFKKKDKCTSRMEDYKTNKNVHRNCHKSD